jgi:hypothetical protein
MHITKNIYFNNKPASSTFRYVQGDLYWYSRFNTIIIAAKSHRWNRYSYLFNSIRYAHK